MRTAILFVVLCSVLGVIGHTWIGIESYPSLDRPSNYVLHGIVGLMLGYFFGIICVIVKWMWDSE
jgi:hypothetical protein